MFETSDVHGYLADTSDGDVKYLMAYIADRVNDARGQADRTILLDAGDIYQGNTISNLMSGNPLSAAFALMGYDAVTIGNHDFDWGIENTVDADGTMMDYDLGTPETSGVNSVKVICANLYKGASKVSFARDYVILNKTAVDAEGRTLPVRVAVIGMAGNYGSSIMPDKFSGAGYRIAVDYGAINSLASELEAEGQCDATILLVHEDANDIATALDSGTAIDLVLGGHTHKTVNGTTSWELPYLEPSCNAKAVARVKMSFSAGEDGPAFSGVTNAKVIQTRPLTNNEENASLLDQRIVQITDAAVEVISPLLNTQIGYITEPVLRYAYLDGSGDRATTAGNWAASIFARITGADVGIVNNGGLRLDMTIPDGSDRRIITRSDIYTMFPFDNRVYLFELTYEELLTALRYSLTAQGATLLSQITGIDVWYTGQEVDALVTKAGQVIYAGGYWKGNWKDKALRVAVCEYVATTDRPDSGLSNPFVSWSKTPRLLDFSGIDNVGAIDVLTAEAERTGGLLQIDSRPHFLNGILPGFVSADFILPADTQTIEAEAFAGSAAASIYVPDSCTFIGPGAFADCGALVRIRLPRNCKIDPSAFENCPASLTVFAEQGGSTAAWANAAGLRCVPESGE